MARPATALNVDRAILVFSIWAVFGFLGLGLLLEGLSRERLSFAAFGVAVIVLAFVAHIIVNGVFDAGFTRGETVLGIGAYGVLSLVFVTGALMGGISTVAFHSGLIFFGVLAVGFLAYLLTRHGLRGAFSQFHVKAAAEREGPR